MTALLSSLERAGEALTRADLEAACKLRDAADEMLAKVRAQEKFVAILKKHAPEVVEAEVKFLVEPDAYYDHDKYKSYRPRIEKRHLLAYELQRLAELKRELVQREYALATFKPLAALRARGQK